MDISLTKDSEKLLSVIYKKYLENRKSGKNKADAKNLGSAHSIQEQLLPE